MQLPAVALLALAAAGFAAAPSARRAAQPPDRHNVVAGWQVDDVADPSRDDRMRRAVRLRHEGRDWEVDYEYVEGAIPVEPSRFAHVVIRGCNRSYGNSERPATRAERSVAARASLVALIVAAQSECPQPADIADEALAGLDAAFAGADAWDRERIAALRPLRARAEAAERAAEAAADAASAAAEQAARQGGGTTAEMNGASEMNAAAPPN